MDDLYLDKPETQDPDGVTMTTPETRPAISLGDAQDRAFRAHFGLGEQSPGLPVLTNAIATGTEDSQRQNAAATSNYQLALTKMGLINEAVRNGANPQEAQIMAEGATGVQGYNPETVFEENYGRTFVNVFMSRNQDLLNKAYAADKNQFLDDMDVTGNTLAKQEGARNLIQELEAEHAQQSWAGTAADFGKMLVPLYTWAKTQNAVDTQGAVTGLLPGSNKEQQYQYLWNLPARESIPLLRSVATAMAKDNQLLAMDFVQGFLGYSTSQKFLDNLFGVVDMTAVGQTAGEVIRGGKALGSLVRGANVGVSSIEMREAAQQAIRANAKGGIIDTIDSTGSTARASEVLAAKTLAKPEDALQQTTKAANDVSELLPRSARMDVVLPPGTAREGADRLVKTLTNQAATMERIVSGEFVAAPVRLPKVAEDAASQAAIAQIKRNAIGDYDILGPIIDTKINPVDPVTNTKSVTVTFGYNSEGFESLEKAKFYAREMYHLADNGWSPRQVGTSWFIDVTRPVAETVDMARGVIATAENKMPDASLLGNLFRTTKIGTPANSLAPLQTDIRNLVTTASQASIRMVEDIARDINRLPKQYKADFEAMILKNRDEWKFSESVPELEKSYMDVVGRLPSDQEISAYFAYTRISDIDWALRNITILKGKMLRGIENWGFTARGETGSIPVRFEGRVVEALPTASGNYSMAIYNPRTGVAEVHSRKTLGEGFLERVHKLQKEEGYRLVQIENAASRPLADVPGIGREPVQFVLTKNWENSPLDMKQLPYNPGGHYDYKHGHWVKQPVIFKGQGGVNNYLGDTTVFNFSTRAQSEKFAKRMEEARILMNTADDARLSAYLAKNLPYTLDTFKGMFGEGKFLDASQPFYATRNSESVGRSHKIFQNNEYFKDLTVDDFDMLQGVNMDYTGKRNERFTTIFEKGSDTRPVFEFRQAPLQDPRPTLARAVGAASRERYFSDYRQSAIETWIGQFGKAMFPDVTQEDLFRNPLKYFYNYKPVKSLDQETRMMAENMRDRTIQLLGVRSETQKHVDYVKEKLSSAVYGWAGQGAADYTVNKLASTRDITSLLRGMTFHSTLGLFNPTQVLVQANGFVTMAAIGGRDAFRALPAAMMSRYLDINSNPEIQRGLAQRFVKFGWKADDILESDRVMRSTGFNISGTEHALRNTMDVPSVFNTATEKFLNLGAQFFNQTEATLRAAAWHTAWGEWRRANPLGSPNQREVQSLLTRANILNNNMTRASNSALQEGVFSIPLQFYGYQMRLMESLNPLAKTQLSAAEKARGIAALSGMYGIPAGAIASWTGIPAYDSLKKAFLDRGWTGGKSDDNPALEAMMEGLPATFIHMLTGAKVNIAQRYGPSGFNQIFDIIKGDKTFAEIVGGAAGGFAQKTLASILNFGKYGLDVLNGDTLSYRPYLTDITDILRNISSVNTAFGLISALNLHKFISKNEVNLGDATTAQAWVKALTGLTPRDITDSQLMAVSNKDRAEFEEELRKDYIRTFRRAELERAAGNEDAAKEYYRRAEAAFVAGNIDPKTKIEWTEDAIKNQSFEENIRNDFWRRGGTDRSTQRFDNFNKSIDDR